MQVALVGFLGALSKPLPYPLGLFMQRRKLLLGSNSTLATIAMGYGVISDIAPPSERGGYVGIVLLG